MTRDFTKAVNHQVPTLTKEEQGEWTEPYFFIFAADPQPGLEDMIKGGDGSKWDIEMQRVKLAVSKINKMQPKPKFVLIGGDLVDAFPGTQHREKQIIDLKEAFSTLDSSIPLLVISGNHDIGNSPTVETIQGHRREFGDEYFSFWCGGVFYIAINSQCYFQSSEVLEICDIQTQWLTSQLESGDEEDSYFAIPQRERMSMLERFADAGVSKVFSGHYHRNGGGVWTRTNSDGSTSQIEMIVTSAIGAQLGDDKPGLRVVKVGENDISHQYYPLEDIPGTVTIK